MLSYIFFFHDQFKLMFLYWHLVKKKNNIKIRTWDFFLMSRSLTTEQWVERTINLRRVWSWLRTNVGGTPNACKSNEVPPFGVDT